jgi:hypothetical protein
LRESLITPADFLMETGDPELSGSGPAWSRRDKHMIKRIAVCAVLLLLIIPAFALAAGHGAEESGKGASAGKGQQAEQGAAGTCSQDQIRSCQQQGSAGSGNTTSGQMLKIQAREQVRDMLKNMIENQTKSGQGSVNSGAGQRQGSVSMQATGAAAGLLQQEDGPMNRGQMLGMKRSQFGDTFGNSTSADQDRDRTRDMAKNQTRLQDGSCSGLTL